MGFKLGTNRGLEVSGGEIKTKMRFGKESGGEGSVPGTPVPSTHCSGRICGYPFFVGI